MRNTGHFVQSAQLFRDLGDFRDSQAQLEELSYLIYPLAIIYYREGNFDRAEEMFAFTTEVGDTENYMTLILSRRFPSSFVDRDTWLAMIGFEDAIEVMNGNDWLFQQFLGMWDYWEVGNLWYNSDGYYIQFDGGYRTNMPTPSGIFDFFNIIDGTAYFFRRVDGLFDFELDGTPVSEFTIVSLNQIKVYSHIGGRIYILDRAIPVY